MKDPTLAWLWLSSLTEVSLNAKAALLEVFGSAGEALCAPPGAFSGIEGISKREAEKLEQILNAAKQAPSSGNSQTNHFLVIQNPTVLRKLALMAEGIDAASRAEAGNIKYDYYRSVNDCDELLLVEKWQDAEALTVHGKQPHFARLGEIKAEFIKDTVIEKYIV